MIVLELSDLITLGTTTTTTCGDDGVRISTDDIATTLTSSMTTASVNNGPVVNIQTSAARNYISCMQVEEVDDLLLQIDERIAELEGANKDTSKVKSLGTINDKKM